MAFKTPASQRPATNPTYAPTRPGAGPTSSSSLSRNLGMYLLLASQRLDEGGTT
jgi:hypothetical protein